MRSKGIIQKLYDKIDELHSQHLSIPESESKLLNKPTMTVVELAKLHKVNREHIEQQLRMGIKVEMEHTGKYEIGRAHV